MPGAVFVNGGWSQHCPWTSTLPASGTEGVSPDGLVLCKHPAGPDFGL